MSNQSIAILPKSADIAQWSAQERASLKALGIDERIPAAELTVFLDQCARTGLNPFAKQIYCIKRGGKFVTQISIDGARLIAERTGEYLGQTTPEYCGEDGVWVEVWASKKPPVAARVGIRRRDFPEPVYGVAHWSDYAPTPSTGVWGSHPLVMLPKCAEMLALRKAFPQDLSGLYVQEEMTANTAQTADYEQQVNEVLAKVEKISSREELRALYESVKPLPFFAQVAEQIVAKGNTLPQDEQIEIIKTSTGEVA